MRRHGTGFEPVTGRSTRRQTFWLARPVAVHGGQAKTSKRVFYLDYFGQQRLPLNSTSAEGHPHIATERGKENAYV